MSRRPAAGGGHWVDIEPERLAGWLARFSQRHGMIDVRSDSGRVIVRGDDGAVAELHPPFADPVTGADDLVGRLVADAVRDRMVGVVLVRLGGFAVGVFRGTELVRSKVGSRHVQGRSAAGGWSQQRFARRRAGQGRQAVEAATEAAVGVLQPSLPVLEAVFLGGDRRNAEAALDDPRLAPLHSRVQDRHLQVPDPRRKVLDAVPRLFRSIRVRVMEPDEGRNGG